MNYEHSSSLTICYLLPVQVIIHNYEIADLNQLTQQISNHVNMRGAQQAAQQIQGVTLR